MHEALLRFLRHIRTLTKFLKPLKLQKLCHEDIFHKDIKVAYEKKVDLCLDIFINGVSMLVIWSAIGYKNHLFFLDRFQLLQCQCNIAIRKITEKIEYFQLLATHYKNPPPLLFLSNPNEALNPLFFNFAEGNKSSSFLSEIKRISMFLSIVFFEESNFLLLN